MLISKFKLSIAGIVALVILLAGYQFWFYQIQPDKVKQHFPTVEKVRLAVAKAFITAPVLIALNNGYFTEVGLDVEVTGQYSSGKAAFEQMLAGNADISTPATTPVVFNSFHRKDYAILVTYTTTYDGVKIIARTDRNILTSSDFKGKTIGIVPGTISQILIDYLLAYNKILTTEVQLKGYKAIDLPQALEKGDVDAISVWEHYAYQALNLMPEQAIQIPSSKVYRIAINLAAMNDYAEQNPLVLQKLIKGLNLAIKFINTEPEKAQDQIADILKLDPTLVKHLWKDTKFELSLDQLLLLTMENEARWALDHLDIQSKQTTNFLELVNSKALKSVMPNAVTLIHKSK